MTGVVACRSRRRDGPAAREPVGGEAPLFGASPNAAFLTVAPIGVLADTLEVRGAAFALNKSIPPRHLAAHATREFDVPMV